MSGLTVYKTNTPDKHAVLSNTLEEIFASAKNPINAEAVRFDGSGYLVNQQIDDVISDQRKKDSGPVWTMMPKRPAEQWVIYKGRKDNFARVYAVDTETLRPDPADVDQQKPQDTIEDPPIVRKELKATLGVIKAPALQRALLDQQKRLGSVPMYGQQLGQETAEITIGSIRKRNQMIINGNNETNVNDYDGLERWIPPTHEYSLDAASDRTRSIASALEKICAIAESDLDHYNSRTYVLTNRAGLNLIQQQEKSNNLYYNQQQITPNIRVVDVLLNGVPIPFLIEDYIPYGKGNSGSVYDEVQYIIYDHNHWVWYGLDLAAFGGTEGNFETQVLDVVNGVTDINQELFVQTRVALHVGTPYYYEQGRTLYRLKVKIPSGMAFGGNGLDYELANNDLLGEVIDLYL